MYRYVEKSKIITISPIQKKIAAGSRRKKSKLTIIKLDLNRKNQNWKQNKQERKGTKNIGQKKKGMLTSNNTTICKGTWKESQIDRIVCRIRTVWLQQDQEKNPKTNNNQIRLKQKKIKVESKNKETKSLCRKKESNLDNQQ